MGVHYSANLQIAVKGGPDLKPPTSEQIFVAVITFSPFLLCRYF